MIEMIKIHHRVRSGIGRTLTTTATAPRQRRIRRRSGECGETETIEPETRFLADRVSGVSSDQWTTTVSSIQGGIAQKTLWIPGVSVLEGIVPSPPAGMKLNGPKKNVGGVGVPNRISFSGGTIPPPPN